MLVLSSVRLLSWRTKIEVVIYTKKHDNRGGVNTMGVLMLTQSELHQTNEAKLNKRDGKHAETGRCRRYATQLRHFHHRQYMIVVVFLGCTTITHRQHLQKNSSCVLRGSHAESTPLTIEYCSGSRSSTIELSLLKKNDGLGGSACLL